MNRRPIPNQHKTLRQIAQEMLQGLNDMLARHPTTKMPFVNFAAEGQTHGGRNAPAVVFNAPQDGAFATRCPGRRQAFAKGKAEFIEDHDFDAVAPRFFLYVPNRGRERRESSLRRVRRPAAGALAASNPSAASTVPYISGDSSRQTLAQSLPQSVPGSSDRWDSPLPVRPVSNSGAMLSVGTALVSHLVRLPCVGEVLATRPVSSVASILGRWRALRPSVAQFRLAKVCPLAASVHLPNGVPPFVRGLRSGVAMPCPLL